MQQVVYPTSYKEKPWGSPETLSIKQPVGNATGCLSTSYKEKPWGSPGTVRVQPIKQPVGKPTGCLLFVYSLFIGANIIIP